MSGPVRIALAQMRSGLDMNANADAAENAVRRAAAEGATFVATPEATNILQRDGDALKTAVSELQDDVVGRRLAHLAAELGIWILAGSLMVRASGGRVANRSVLFDDAGIARATYDKIHMFDIAFGDGESYTESDTVAPGGQAVVAASPMGPLGLTVCYDLRFPHLYRALAQAGAAAICVPAAFTRRTGAAHWEILLRARAIETGAFILAPAQGGRHADGRATWGHSMVVAPWGEVIGALGHDEPDVLIVDIDRTAVDRARATIPSLRHDRDFRGAVTAA